MNTARRIFEQSRVVIATAVSLRVVSLQAMLSAMQKWKRPFELISVAGVQRTAATVQTPPRPSPEVICLRVIIDSARQPGRQLLSRDTFSRVSNSYQSCLQGDAKLSRQPQESTKRSTD